MMLVHLHYGAVAFMLYIYLCSGARIDVPGCTSKYSSRSAALYMIYACLPYDNSLYCIIVYSKN